jgi:hypothetical protein
MFAVADKHNLFTPIESVVAAVERFLGSNKTSGEFLEIVGINSADVVIVESTSSRNRTA